MEQRLSEQFIKQEHILFEQRRTNSSGSEQVTETKLQQIEEERKIDKKVLSDRLDRLQARIDAVMGEIDNKLRGRMDEQNISGKSEQVLFCNNFFVLLQRASQNQLVSKKLTWSAQSTAIENVRTIEAIITQKAKRPFRKRK